MRPLRKVTSLQLPLLSLKTLEFGEGKRKL